MARKLRSVKLDEISFVGKGDNPEAHVLLLKVKKETLVKAGKEYDGENKSEILKEWFEANVALFKDEDGAETFAEIAADRELRDKMWTLCYMLEESLGSIVRDDSVTDKAAMLANSIEQFKAAVTAITKGENKMTPEEIAALKKAKEEADAKIAELTKQNEELLEKASKCPECGSVMKEGKCEKGCGKKVEKELDVLKGLPEAIVKEIQDNRARIAKMEDESLTREYVAKAAEVVLVGKADELGDLLKAIAKHDIALATKTLDILKTANARIQEGDLLKEKGSSEGGSEGTSAYDKIVAKAAELRKADPSLSEAKAFTKVYDSNEELRKAYLAERG